MNCPNCNELLPSDSAFCFNCGERVEINEQSVGEHKYQNSQPQYSFAGESPTYQKKSGGFFSFDRMITPLIIKLLFIIGLIIIAVFGLTVMATGFSPYEAATPFIFIGVAIIIFGGLLWRVYCELLIIFFKIYESLEEIRRNK